VASEQSDRITFAIGTVLLAMYIAQGWLGLACEPLVRLQQDELYKVASGCVLAAYLLHQSLVARRRVWDPVGAVFWHKLAGALAPVVLYLHAARFAYGYLLLLSIGYLGAIGIALLHRPIVRARLRTLYTCWFILHVATTSSVVVLGGYHVVIALAYE